MSPFLFPLILFLSLTFCVQAQDGEQIKGAPIVEPDLSLRIDGKRLQLWGITLLAQDQQCWNKDIPWPCGEQASLALRHDMAGQNITCLVKERLSATEVTAQCFKKKKGVDCDIGKNLLRQGWAFADPRTADGDYELEQVEAQTHRHGIWGSDFQTPEDWKNGVERFIREKEE